VSASAARPVYQETSEPIATPTADPLAPAEAASEASAIPEPASEEIARLAYSYWEARGRQGGSAEEDWFRAEQELRARA